MPSALINLKTLGGRKPKSLLERFHAANIPEPMSGCWLWLGAPQAQFGYGRIKPYRGAAIFAHRLSYEVHRGPIPQGEVQDAAVQGHRDGCRVRTLCRAPLVMRPTIVDEMRIIGKVATPFVVSQTP